jgi:hypothetical protein
MAKKIEFVFDFESKDVQIASERTLTLAQQVKVLKNELQKTKEGTAEFEILRNKLNDTQDSFERVNSKTKDLFGTLSLIPGPIGDIAGKLNGTLSLFKTFSGFNFKDIKTQFIDIIDDVKLVGSSFAKATGLSKVFAATTTGVSKALKLVGIEATTASFGVRAFSAALISTGIGAIVVGLGLLVEAFIKAGNETDIYKEKLESLNREIEFNRNASKRRAAEEIAEAKSRGASEEELAAIRRKNNLQTIKDLENEKKIRDAEATRTALNQKKEPEAYKAAREAQIKIDEDIANARSQLRIDDFNEQERLLKKGQELAKQNADKQKQLDEKRKQESRQFRQEEADAELQLIKDSEATKEEELRKALQKQFAIKNEGKKQSVAVQKAQAAEIERIVKEELEKDKKANQEKEKLRKDFLDKIKEIQIAGIADETQREEAQRRDKFEKDKKALEEDTQFRKLNKLAQAAILLQLEQTLNNDLAEIRKKRLTKEQEDERTALNNQLEIIKNQYMFLNKFSEEYFLAREQELELQRQNELIGVEEGSKKALEIERKYSELRKQLKQEETAALGQLIGATLDSFANLGNAIASTYDEEAKTSEEAFNKRKKLQKATALISAASGIVQILTQPSILPSPVDWIVKGVNAAALGVATAVQIGKINATTFEAPNSGNTEPRKLASGGIVVGPGGPKDDKVPTLLSNGESVINARSTELFRPLLSTINQIGGGRKFANGGIVSSNYTQQQALNEVNSTLGLNSETPIKTYVVATDMTSQQMFDRAQKSRSTL